MSHITTAEIRAFWTIAALIGTLVTTRILWRRWRSYIAALSMQQGDQREASLIVASQNLRTDFVFTIITGGVFLAGFVSFATATRPPPPGGPSPYVWVLGFVLVIAMSSIVVSSTLTTKEDNRLMGLWRSALPLANTHTHRRKDDG